MKNPTWKKVEDQVRDLLQELSDTHKGFAFHRYPDSRAAGGHLAKQPSDFLACSLTTHGVSLHWHIEAKETAYDNRVPKNKIRQYGMLKKFYWAGVIPLVVIKRSTVGDYMVLTASELFAAEECPPSFPLTGLKSFPTAQAALMEYLKV